MAASKEKSYILPSATQKGSKRDKMSESLRSTLNKGSETAFDFHCDLCYKDDNYVEAVGYCADCKDYLCQECYNHHLKPRPMRHHVLLNQQIMPKATSQRQSKDMCTEPCAEHKNKILKYYCADHNKFGCSVCMTLHHRNCEGVDYIPDIAGDVLTSREYKDINLKLKDLIDTAQKTINTTQQKTQTSNQQHSDASEFFKQLKKDLIAAVDRIENLTMNNAGKIRDGNQKNMKSVADQCNQLLKDIGSLDSKFTSLENMGQHCQSFFSMKTSQDEIASLETSLLHLQDQSNITEYEVKINDDLKNLIQRSEKMASLEIINIPKPSTLQAAHGVSSSQLKIQQTLVPDHTITSTTSNSTVTRASVWTPGEHKTIAAVHEADIDVRIKDDRDDPWITGSVMLPGDKLVIVDCGNDIVKLINLQSNKIVAHLKYDDNLWGITAVTNTQVAVTSTDDKTILFKNVNTLLLTNVTETITLDHKVKVNGECMGIACIRDKLVIIYSDPVKVEIISQKGKLLQTVVTEDRGRQLFTCPDYVAVSSDQQTLYMSDYNQHAVTSLDLSGKVKATYKELEYPYGMTLDKTGLLYVCGYLSHNIHQLTTDLHKIKIVLQESDGIVYPTSVSYNDEQNKLYIGSRIIKVYQLQSDSNGPTTSVN